MKTCNLEVDFIYRRNSKGIYYKSYFIGHYCPKIHIPEQDSKTDSYVCTMATASIRQ